MFQFSLSEMKKTLKVIERAGENSRSKLLRNSHIASLSRQFYLEKALDVTIFIPFSL